MSYCRGRSIASLFRDNPLNGSHKTVSGTS